MNESVTPLPIRLALATMFGSLSGQRLSEAPDDPLIKRQVITECFTLLANITSLFKGRRVKIIGNRKGMWIFPTAQHAYDAACAMAKKLEESGMEISVGFHYGPVIEESGDTFDVFGESVNLAARVAEQASPGEILTTKATVDQLTPKQQERTHFLSRTWLKGMQEANEIFKVLWEDEDQYHADIINVNGIWSAPLIPDVQIWWLRVTFCAQEFMMKPGHRGLTLGRMPRNDIIILDSNVSRVEHARIDFLGNKFVLRDRSVNGTYINTQDGEELFLRRDDFHLQGSGIISPGRRPEPGIDVVCYALQQADV